MTRPVNVILFRDRQQSTGKFTTRLNDRNMCVAFRHYMFDCDRYGVLLIWLRLFREGLRGTVTELHSVWFHEVLCVNVSQISCHLRSQKSSIGGITCCFVVNRTIIVAEGPRLPHSLPLDLPSRFRTLLLLLLFLNLLIPRFRSVGARERTDLLVAQLYACAYVDRSI